MIRAKPIQRLLDGGRRRLGAALAWRPPKQARRAIDDAARDRNARIAAGGAVAGAGVLAAAAEAIRRRRRGRSRAYRLRSWETAADGIRRIALGRADDALEQLRDGVERDFPAAIHEARKDLKKLRSVLRLVRKELGDELYRRENNRFRDTGRMLSGARDAEVKLGAVRDLCERFPERLSAERLAPLIGALEGERDRHVEANRSGGAVAVAIREIEAGRAVIEAWPLEADGWKLIEPGLRRQYRRGRKRFAAARDEPTNETIHEWRKRVKDLWYHLRILRDVDRDTLAPAIDDSHRLSELLGDHHDLAVMRQDALGRREPLAAGELDRLLAAITERQRQLLAEAMPLGERIYAEKPKALSKRVRRRWNARR